MIEKHLIEDSDHENDSDIFDNWIDDTVADIGSDPPQLETKKIILKDIIANKRRSVNSENEEEDSIDNILSISEECNILNHTLVINMVISDSEGKKELINKLIAPKKNEYL